MDTTISALRREAATGDPAAEARLLVARLRAGTLDHLAVALACLCAVTGDELGLQGAAA